MDEEYANIRGQLCRGRTSISTNEAARALNSLTADLEDAKRYKEALDEYLVANWLYTDELMADPRKALHAIACAAERDILDPSISEPAQKLRDTYKAELEQAKRERDEAVGLTSDAQQILDVISCFGIQVAKGTFSQKGLVPLSKDASDLLDRIEAFLARIQEKQDDH